MNKFLALMILLVASNAFCQDTDTMSGREDPNLRNIIDFFPDETPGEVLFYTPPFLQGGSELQVLIQSDAANYWNKLMDRMISIHSGPLDDIVENGKDVNDSIMLFVPQVLNSGETSLGEEWKVGVIYNDRKANNWNHGRAAGVAINDSEDLIIFWAKAW